MRQDNQYKKLNHYQQTFLNVNGSTMSALELSRSLGLSPTKIKVELKKSGIIEFKRMPSQSSNPAKWAHLEKHKYVKGLEPKKEVPFVRPPSVYTNKRYTYLEIEAIQ